MILREVSGRVRSMERCGRVVTAIIVGAADPPEQSTGPVAPLSLHKTLLPSRTPYPREAHASRCSCAHDPNGHRGEEGPSEYRAGSRPGANVDVYDVGQLSGRCYPSWVLSREGISRLLPLGSDLGQGQARAPGGWNYSMNAA